VNNAAAIDIHDLRKSFGDIAALDGLTLTVPRGSICGFLGPNGSGKTTTIKVLLGMVKPTSGRARVFGLPADEPGPSVAIRQRIGFVSEDKDAFDSMTVGDLVRFTAAFYPRWRQDLEGQYLKQFALKSDQKIQTLSRGARTRLSLLLAFCRGADLLILDEPTSGLDPVGAEEVLKAIVSHVAREEMTVFFSSHHMAEVEQIADRIVILKRGRAVVEGALDDVRAGFCRVRLVFADAAPAVDLGLPEVRRVERDGRTLALVSSGGPERIAAAARALNPVSVDVVPMTLKDIFLDSVED